MQREGNPLVLSRVVGDVLGPFTPTTDLRVSGDGSVLHNGIRLRPSQVSVRPRVEIGGDSRMYYTFVMVDADTPNPGNPYLREYLHWLVTDIPANTETSFGNELVDYEPPEPSMGIHRIVMVLFRQPGPQIMTAPEWRQNFNIRQFAQLYNLGSPVAALYYNCHRENSTGRRRAS